MKNSPNLILSILVLLALACSCPKSENTQTGQTYMPSPRTSNSETQQNTVSKTPIAFKSISANTGSVISENAAFRQSPNGKVLQTLPVDSSVEVMRQKGAWFYVAYGGAKGWMHGNTIRLNNPPDNLTTTKIPNKDSKSSTYNNYESTTVDKSNPSGATAKCRDGTLSYSASRRGTCSHHGGVAVWY
jgi:hypothetical protein